MAGAGGGTIERAARRDQLTEHAQPAVAEDHEIELAVIEARARRDLEAPPVPGSVADDRFEDAPPASPPVDLDPYSRAATTEQRAQRGERERAVAMLDR